MHAGMNYRRLWFAVTLLLWVVASARADVITVLSRNETQVGRPVALVYRFVNTAEPENMPQSSMAVDGLQIVFQGAGRQSNFSFSFGAGGAQNRAESVIEYTYEITPMRPGEFTIPSLEVRVGGKTIRTEPAKLSVAGAGNYATPAQPGAVTPPVVLPGQSAATPQASGSPGRVGEGEPFFADLLMTSKPVYVGEVVPVDIRFYFRGDLPVAEMDRPVFAGDGFTAMPLGEPQQGEQTIGNDAYRVLTFRTAVTAVKTGEIEIPPVTMNANIMVSAVPQGIDPMFAQILRNFGGSGFGRAERVELSTRGRKLKVLPLPKESRPEKFSGAVGEFTMEASADPTSAGPGDPVTLSVSISGRGNFDTMAEPVLTGVDGWRTYKAKEKFQKDNPVGFTGMKTFDFKMIALTDRTATPGAEFHYFDPRKKEYVTLRAEPQPVTAAGRASSADVPVPGAASTSAAPAASPIPGAAPTAAPAEDIAAPAQVLSPTSAHQFCPNLHSSWFRATHVALLALSLVVLPVLLWWRHRRKKSAVRAGLERALRQARAEMNQASDRTAFYSAAARVVQARIDLLAGRVGSVPDAAALQQYIADPVERRELQSVLARRDELKYGGGSGGPWAGDERQRAVAVLEKFAVNP